MNTKLLLSTIVAAGLSLQAGAAITVYTETFDNTTAGNISLAAGTGTPDWGGAHSVTGTAFDNTVTDPDLGPITSNAASSTGVAPTGYLFGKTFGQFDPVIYYVDGLNLGSPAGGTTLDEVSFALRNESTSQNMQIVLQFGAGTDWFLGDTTFNNSVANSWTSGLTLDLSTETWKALTIDVENEITVGAAASPSNFATSNLTGIGFYTATTDDSSIRIDTLSVTAVPEPATYALFGGFIALGLVMLRRRRR
jgi:hypothetical protein